MDGLNDRRHREDGVAPASNEDWWHPALGVFERDHRTALTAPGPIREFEGYQRLSEEFQKMRETGERLCLLWLRIGASAHANGHDQPEETLSTHEAIGRMLVSWLRTTDTVVIVSPEEFFVILPDTEYFDALHVASSLESAIHRWKLPHGVRLDARVGVSEPAPEDDSAQTLLERARQSISEDPPASKWGSVA